MMKPIFLATHLLFALIVGAIVIILAYQIPSTHNVDIGGYDTAYVQGWYDPQYGGNEAPPYVQGSDGRVRWSREQSFLVFPQVGLPANITLRMRGWRANNAPPPVVTIWLNGKELLGTLQTSSDWEEHTFSITGGLLKPSDVVIEIRSSTVVLPGDDRHVGILLDRATYTVSPTSQWFIIPYPAQVLFGTFATFLFFLAFHALGLRTPSLRGKDLKRFIILFSLIMGVLFLVCYRLQPPLYPYPFHRLLLMINVLLIGFLIIRYVPSITARRPFLIDVAALVGVGVWLIAVLLASQNHLTLSVPGVEKDFRVFATRTSRLDKIFQSDGFYHLGYPLLLWLVMPLTQSNPFLAARIIAALSGAIFLLSGYWLARTLATIPHNLAFLALLILIFNPLVVQYSLYVSSDMPFAALATLAIALFATYQRKTDRTDIPKPFGFSRNVLPTQFLLQSWRIALPLALSGIVAGGAFLIRHAGFVLLPWGIIAYFMMHVRDVACNGSPTKKRSYLPSPIPIIIFIIGFLLAALPQLVVNVTQTGELFYSQQAKNVWLAVYGNTDWGRWDEVPNSITMQEIILRDPVRFMSNWGKNIVGFIGRGAEDSSEYGQAIQLRILSAPVNWLAIIGLIGWGMHITQCKKLMRLPFALLLFIALYVLGISTAFLLPRFFLPLVPIYAIAAAWAIQQAIMDARRAVACNRSMHAIVLINIVLLIVLWGGFANGTRYVLERQPSDEQAVLQLALERVPPNEKVLMRVLPEVPLNEYSALAHRAVSWDNTLDEHAMLAQAQAQGIHYVLWDKRMGSLNLPSDKVEHIGEAGTYVLVKLMLIGQMGITEPAKSSHK